MNDLILNSLAENEQSLLILNSAKDLAQTKLQGFAQSQDFEKDIALAFGQGRNDDKFRSIWLTGKICFPAIEIRTKAELAGAYGAFSQDTGKIYLSQELINSSSTEFVSSVLLHEYGHYVDTQLNTSDSPGDEGAIFSDVVQGKLFEPEELQQLKSRHDTATITLDGQLVQIEQAQPVSKSGGVGGLTLPFQLDPLPQGQTEKNITVNYSYEHYSIPDQFEIRYGATTIFSTQGFVSGGKQDSRSFKQTSGNDQLTIKVTAPQSGTAWQFSVSTDNADVSFDGLIGDVIKLAGYDGFTLGQQKGNLTLKSLPDSNKGKLIDDKGENATVGKVYKALYYVPKVNGAISSYGQEKVHPGVGQVKFDVEDQNQKSLTVSVNVTDGFSVAIPGPVTNNAVTFKTGKLDIYSQQQRLAYLGFPGSGGSPLVVDGQTGGNTTWAIRLFNSVVSSSRKLLNENTLNKDNAKQFINATNAPRWNELESTSITRVGTVQNAPIEVWGANWTYDLLRSLVPSNPNINFNVSATSIKRGGDTTGHSGHEAGVDLDIDSAGLGDPTYAPNNMFYKENKFGTQTWYVETPGGQVVIRNASGKYESAAPTPANLSKAITGQSIFNSTVISQLFSDSNNNGQADQNEWLISDNPNAIFRNTNGSPTKGYVLQDVRSLITSFLNANVGGVTVTKVRFNDPRTWDIDPNKVVFTSSHNGHVHFDIKAPIVSSNSNLRVNSLSFASQNFDLESTDALSLNTATISNSAANSSVIELGKIEGSISLTGSTNTTNPEAIYRFTLGEAVNEDKIEDIYFSTTRNFNLLLDQLSADVDVELIKDFNGDGVFQDEDVIASSNQLGNNPEILSSTDLNESEYYIRVFQKGGDTSFNLSLTVPPLPVPTDNAGNAVTNAKNLGDLINNAQQSDFIGQVDADDYYRFTLSSTNDLNFDATGFSNGDLFAELGQDINNDGILDFDEIISTSDEEGDTTEKISRTGLAAGDYILHLGRNSGNTNYNLNLSATPSVILPDKAGSTLGTAFNLNTLTASTQSDFVGNVDPTDYYRFTLTNPSGVTLKLSGLSADADLELSQDKNGDGIISSDEVIQLSEETDNQDENINLAALPAGDYFVLVSQYDGDTNYSLALTPTTATGIDLQVTVTPVADSLTLGDQVSYTVTVINIGASIATGVTLSDNLPLESIFGVSAVASKGTASVFGNEITANIGSLDVNESATLVVSGRLVGSGSTSSLIQASSAETDFNPDNDSVVQRFNVAPGAIQPADLELSLTSNKSTANIDDIVTLRLTLRNKGIGAATSIKVKQVLASGLTFVSSNIQQGTYDSVSGIWDAGNIGKGNEAFIDITTKVTSGGSLFNTAEIIALAENDPDSTPNNNNPNEDDQSSVFVNSQNANPDGPDLEVAPNSSAVTLAVSPTTVTENGTANLVYTFTRSGITTNALTVNYSIAGTADSSDYTGATPGTSKTITFAAGAATANLTIDPTADNTVESNETVALTLAAGTGYSIGVSDAVVGTILNDDLLVINAFVTAEGAGGNTLIKLWDSAGSLNQQFNAFAGFNGSVSVAYGDLNGDGVKDIVAAAGPGGGPHVKVFDGQNGNVIASFFAYDPGFAGGVNVAIGDVNGDGAIDIITGAGAGGGPHVKAFALTFNGGQAVPQEIVSFFAYDSNFRGGVSVASGNIDGLGADEIITGAGAGGGPHVKAFSRASNGTLNTVSSFFAYDSNFRGGVSVASGNIDGLGPEEIITGAGAGGGPHVKAFSRASDGTLNTLSSFFAYDPDFRGGVNVGTMMATSVSGVSAMLTGAGPSGGPDVRSWDLTQPDLPQAQLGFYAYDASFRGGVSVS